jgi:hypothetical protein
MSTETQHKGKTGNRALRQFRKRSSDDALQHRLFIVQYRWTNFILCWMFSASAPTKTQVPLRRRRGTIQGARQNLSPEEDPRNAQ